MARLERFELPTARFVAEYSIQLSYRRLMVNLYGREGGIIPGFLPSTPPGLCCARSKLLISTDGVYAVEMNGTFPAPAILSNPLIGFLSLNCLTLVQIKQCSLLFNYFFVLYGGEGGIRTLEGL